MSPIDNPLTRLIGAAEEAGDDDVRATTFVRGLALGALVGAAIAGSTIWQRRHARLARPGVPAGLRQASAEPGMPSPPDRAGPEA